MTADQSQAILHLATRDEWGLWRCGKCGSNHVNGIGNTVHCQACSTDSVLGPQGDYLDRVRQDFEAWSGGFPPESPEQVAIYVTYALSKDLLAEAVRDWLLTQIGEWTRSEPCDCELPGYFCCGVPGVLAHVENGQSTTPIERCDACERYASDEGAQIALQQSLQGGR